MTTKNSIISQGTSYRIYDSSVETHDELPVATYRVKFNPMAGYSLLRVEDIEVGSDTIYGTHKQRLERMSQAYSSTDRSLGVIMSGDKGMGKSLMIRLLAEHFATERNLATVLVDANSPGLAEFLDTLGETVVVFDEFEKKFNEDEDSDAQSQFLGLFDGISSHKRLYVVTVNRVEDLNDFMINRPGRFHYHIRFNYPTSDEVRQYLRDQVADITDEQVEDVAAFALRTKINYDHLRSIAFELKLGGEFADIIGDLNIKNLTSTMYTVTVTFSDGVELKSVESIGSARARRGNHTQIYIAGQGSGAREYTTTFDHSKLVALNGKLTIPDSAVTSERIMYEDAAANEVEVRDVHVVSRTLELLGQDSYAF